MEKVIQIANLCKGMCNTSNPMPGRVYLAKGISPALNTGGVENTDVSMDKAKVKHKLRYALGRTNAGGKGQGNHTISFHVNSYFGCMTASKFSNRETWILEITPPDYSCGHQRPQSDL